RTWPPWTRAGRWSMRTTAPRRLREGSATHTSRARGSLTLLAVAALATVVAMLLGLAGCSVGGTAPPVTLPPPAAAAPDLVEGLEEVLQARTDALLAGDVDGWRSVLVDDPEFVAAQEQYFDNLVQLPLALYDIEIAED